jgi:hypothetical protein
MQSPLNPLRFNDLLSTARAERADHSTSTERVSILQRPVARVARESDALDEKQKFLLLPVVKKRRVDNY